MFDSGIINKLVILGLALGVAGIYIYGPKGNSSNQTWVEPSKDPWFIENIASEAKPVLVKFGADWCPPCRTMDQTLDSVAATLDPKVKVIRVNVDEQPAIAAHYRVSSIPRTFLFYQGNVLANQLGALDSNELIAWVDKSLSKIQ